MPCERVELTESGLGSGRKLCPTKHFPIVTEATDQQAALDGVVVAVV